MSKYEEIIERLGKAAGPDREIDRLIANALLPWHGPDDCYPPHFAHPVTASLDAALALVERKIPGFGWTLDGTTADLPEGNFNIGLYGAREWNGRPYLGGGSHKLLPLALCLALLRALEVQDATVG